MGHLIRWKILLGCLLLAALEAPGSALVFVQDLQGPWREARNAEVPASETSSRSSATLSPTGAQASLALENRRELDRDPSPGLALRHSQVLAAR